MPSVLDVRYSSVHLSVAASSQVSGRLIYYVTCQGVAWWWRQGCPGVTGSWSHTNVNPMYSKDNMSHLTSGFGIEHVNVETEDTEYWVHLSKKLQRVYSTLPNQSWPCKNNRCALTKTSARKGSSSTFSTTNPSTAYFWGFVRGQSTSVYKEMDASTGNISKSEKQLPVQVLVTLQRWKTHRFKVESWKKCVRYKTQELSNLPLALEPPA
jgi:hypothetical protein